MKRSSTAVSPALFEGYNRGVILARLIAVLTLGAAAVAAGGMLVTSGHQVAGLVLDALAVVAMRAAVEAHPTD